MRVFFCFTLLCYIHVPFLNLLLAIPEEFNFSCFLVKDGTKDKYDLDGRYGSIDAKELTDFFCDHFICELV